MSPQRYFLARSLVGTSIGLLVLAVVLFVVKLVLEVAYVVAGGLALAGLVLLIAGIVILRL
jgi:lipopolysaccharide export LptBFGC system permease protein LptF